MKTQQKERSRLLTVLWANDNFHNEWNLISRVYSFLRDEIGKANVPIQSFLNYACPAMGLIPPGQYLEHFHLVPVIDTTGHLVLRRTEQKIIRSRPISTTEYDLLCTCISNGYMVDNMASLLDKMAVKYRSTMFIPRVTTEISNQEELSQIISEPGSVPSNSNNSSPSSRHWSISRASEPEVPPISAGQYSHTTVDPGVMLWDGNM